MLFDFIKSFKKIASECGIVPNWDGNVRAALGNKFGFQIVQTDDYDPDKIGFVKWLCIHGRKRCVNTVI